VVTVHTPLDHTLRYDNCIWIDRYESAFETAGGINLPKINICYGSNGEKYKQLVSCFGNCVDFYHGSVCSSKAKVVMTCAKMQSWSRCLTS
jgi:hypothetical protein